MFRIMALFFIFGCLYFLITEILNFRKRSVAAKKLANLEAERDIISMEEEAAELEKENMKRKMALYDEDGESAPKE